ncbi:hypothetical protein [Nocardia rhizosphaerihabitans]|uniref:Uncharacterized protein n=1 Tax=Nocardia rhizosphaerihabitans TaxID=1691570 RepID=A0ABQ2KJ64_9NOCA|nr:hypothetical protein [Nocardia rhizosphaerihabitans]GGN81123.1 hypothetical protein GCM10011610_31200 [Nocardia rhizosphaerihabitans]
METTVEHRGLTDAEAVLRNGRDEADTPPEPPSPNRIGQFAAQLTHFFAAMLLTPS